MPLTAYFDASGHERDQTHLVVAGFISSDADWKAFSAQWNTCLDRSGLSRFHAFEFAHSVGEFSEWKHDEPRRRRLCVALMKIIEAHVYRKFSNGVSNPQLGRSVLKDARLSEMVRINAYSLVGRTVVADVGRWFQEVRWEGSPRYVFEAGDVGAGALKNWLEHDGHPSPTFEDKASAPLQAADWLAYEIFQAFKNREAIMRGASPRWAFKEFDRRIVGTPNFYSAENLLSLETNLATHAGLLRYDFPHGAAGGGNG